MSITARKRAAFAALVLLAVWPLVHHALVRRYEISPWKFFGWSMYCVRLGDLRVRLYPIEGGGTPPASWAAGQPAAVTDAMTVYLNRRRTWGLLLPPDELAEVVFREAPGLAGFRIALSETVLDPDTAFLVAREHDYEYFRKSRE